MVRLSAHFSLAFFILSVFALTPVPSGGPSSYITHTSNGSYTLPYTSSKCLTCNTTMTKTGGQESGTATPTGPAGKLTGGAGDGGATSAPQNGGAVSALEDVKSMMMVGGIVLGAFVMAMGI